MNKITSVLAGIAVAATASIAPAFAQGAFTSTGPFTFTRTSTTASVLNAPVVFNPTGGTTSNGTATLSLTGGTAGSPFFSFATLTFTPTTGTGFTDTFNGGADLNLITGSSYQLVSAMPSLPVGGDTFNLYPGSPVPESSTVVSFGALLTLGGMAVVLRRKGVKNAA